MQLGKTDGSKVSNLDRTSAWQRRSIARSNSRGECKRRWSDAVCNRPLFPLFFPFLSKILGGQKPFWRGRPLPPLQQKDSVAARIRMHSDAVLSTTGAPLMKTVIKVIVNNNL